MSLFQDLGPFGPVLGVSDAVWQVNPFLRGTGWTVVFDQNTLSSNLTGCEVYHISLTGPVGSQVAVLRNAKVWDYALGWLNGWDPSQPLPLGSSTQVGQIAVCWNVAFTAPPYSATNIQPSATLWLRQPTS